MLFAKKKNLRFDEMEHIESPNLSELEATLDFLKKTPEKKDEDNGNVLHPLPAIEPPKLDTDKKMAVSEENEDAVQSSLSQDIAFDDASPDGTDGDGPSATDISEEIIKRAEALREKQLLNESVNTEAELALKKDEANVTKTSDESDDMPQKEVSDAVKAAMALQAEYDAKKKDQPMDPRSSRFIRGRAYPIKKEAELTEVQNEDAQAGNAEGENSKVGADQNDKIQEGSVMAESAAAGLADMSNAAATDGSGDVNELSAPEVPGNGKTDLTLAETEKVENDDSDKNAGYEKRQESDGSDSKERIESTDETDNPEGFDGTAEDVGRGADGLTETTEDRDVGDEEKGTVSNNANDGKKEDEAKSKIKFEEKKEDKNQEIKKTGASTAITSNLKLPNDVIVSNIESSARSLGKYAGAAKIANPLPHPKKHITRNMDFDYPVSAAQMHFDIEDLNGMDFFDIDD